MNIQKHDANDNNNQNPEEQNNSETKTNSDIAETVVMMFIDKLISTSVLTSKVNHTYKTINDHCFNYLTNFINPYLETTFIFYENGKEDLDYQKNQIYFSSKPLEKINTWEFIPEPNSIEIDRYSNTKTKVMKYNKYTDNNLMEGVKESSRGFDIDDNVLNESTDIQNKNKEKYKNTPDRKNKEIYKENKDINNSNIKPKNPSLKQSNKNLLENTKTQPKNIKIIQRKQ